VLKWTWPQLIQKWDFWAFELVLTKEWDYFKAIAFLKWELYIKKWNLHLTLIEDKHEIYFKTNIDSPYFLTFGTDSKSKYKMSNKWAIIPISLGKWKWREF
jgi:hypothetical protein